MVRVARFLCLASLLPALAASAQAPAPLDDRAAFEAWLDGLMAAQLGAYHIAGATVSFVHNGEVVFEKGYGYADVDARIHVDPATTLFRIGSVSKLFVWIAVMQLQEDGKLDLNADVNDYLTDIQVPRRYGSPVTMKHLMTHTAGFEDQVIGLFSRDAGSMRPIGEILEDELPARVREPGQIASYSNHGTGLAMHIVEEITGRSWQDYLRENILDPLGMSHTILAQPVPESHAKDLSKGYAYQGFVLVEKPFEFVPLGPVGGVSASAGDMARLMLMFLEGGEYAGARVLEASTALTMQSELHRMASGVNPMAYGMMDTSRSDLRIVGHSGDTIYFHTLFALFPEHDAGLFVSYNSVAGGQARGDLVTAFAKRFFVPGDPEKLIAPPDFESRAARFTGPYRVNRYSHRTLAKLGAGLAPVNVTHDNNALKISSMGNVRWIEVKTNEFQEENGDRRIVFIVDSDGKITHFALAGMPILAFERIGPLGTPELHFALFVGTIVVCLLAVLLWPSAALARWRHGVVASRQLQIPVYARALGWCAALLFLVFVAMFIGGIEDPNEIAFGLSQPVKVLLGIPLVILLLAVAMFGVTVHLWVHRRGRFVWRTLYSVVTLALLVFVWQAFYWNLTILQNIAFV